MYYLKYRPQKVSEIDNASMRIRLQKILETVQIPHAFLFTGPKGTGKTSSGRIIARAVNCENNLFARVGTSFEPCNDCAICRSILFDMSSDVIELDGASNRRIEDIREITENVKFAPLVARYKVFIIDEVHMLTKEAFNALLKTLEEPPKQVIFILATTDRDKLPKTILSRCVEVVISGATQEDLLGMLRRICLGEDLKIDEDILLEIIKYSDRSFRNGAKILEELVISGNHLDKQMAKKYLSAGLEGDLLLSIAQNKKIATIEMIENYCSGGGSSRSLIEQTMARLHSMLLHKSGIPQENLEVELENKFDIPQITRLLKIFQSAYEMSRSTPIESLPLVIGMIEYFSTN